MEHKNSGKDLKSNEKSGGLAKETMIADAGEKLEDKTFKDFDLSDETLAVVANLGWDHPTSIQGISLPKTLRGEDLAGFAQTGTGKTGAFILTWIEKALKKSPEDRKSSFAVTVVPTRELAMQIESDARQLVGDIDLNIISIFGGMDYEKQAKALKEIPDLVVATPGRLKDFHEKKVVDLGKCDLFICDEADRMLDMGFISDVEYFLDHIPENCQKLLFSATTNETVKELAFEYLNNPEYIFANPDQITPENIKQYAIHCRAAEKLKVVLGLFRDLQPEISVFFVNTKLVADWLHYKLNHNGIEADIITGDLAQRKRIQLIKNIKAGKIKVLIATDVASRGLHIAGLSHVFNFDLPDDPSNYIHRIGRTARAGAEGCAYTLVCEDYGGNLKDINDLLGDELSLNSEWFDKSYLEIEDKAGNPYENGALQMAPRKDAGSKGSDRGPRKGASSGQRDRKPGAKGGDRKPGGHGKSRHASGKSNDNRNNKNRSNRGQEQGKRRQPKKYDNKGKRPNDKQQVAKQPAAAEPTGFIKKFFKTIFGGKSK